MLGIGEAVARRIGESGPYLSVEDLVRRTGTGRPQLEALATSVGSISLPNPVLTASGTSGHGVELSEYGALNELGAVVVKSLSVEPWAGNAAPRVHEVGAGMLNSVGLQGPVNGRCSL